MVIFFAREIVPLVNKPASWSHQGHGDRTETNFLCNSGEDPYLPPLVVCPLSFLTLREVAQTQSLVWDTHCSLVGSFLPHNWCYVSPEVSAPSYFKLGISGWWAHSKSEYWRPVPRKMISMLEAMPRLLRRWERYSVTHECCQSEHHRKERKAHQVPGTRARSREKWDQESLCSF
jgi:hypothetical protein